VRAPPTIIQLPDQVANQIAAGEVIERPAAVVKELCENSLDAGATAIHVRCEDGGRRLVEVVDDGHGMRSGDLARALGRHATSKLRDADDLFKVASLGFRGEALPSIAAVAECELASRPHDADAGHVIAITAGETLRSLPCAMAPGTRISVRNLFWNVPVRLKFLKSEAAEAGHVTEQVIRLALGHPSVAFRLDLGGRTALDLPAGQDLTTRIRAIFGKTFAERLLSVGATADRLQVAGFVAHPNEAQASTRRQYVFLNGRYLRDKLLIAAVRDGYKGFLEPRLHGACVLHLDLDPGLVDVNVHPTKAEVRFRRDGEVFATVAKAIHETLSQNQGGFSVLAPQCGTGGQAPGTGNAGLVRTVIKEPVGPPVIQERFLPAQPPAGPAPSPTSTRPAWTGSLATPTAAADQAMIGPLHARAESPRTLYQAPRAATAAPASAPSDEGVDLPGVRRVIQLNDSYLLIETRDGIRLVDQHALHEKALFLTLDPKRQDWRQGGVQELLTPKTIELTAADVAIIEPQLAALAEHGIQAEVFGPTTLLLRAHPAALRRTDWTAFFAYLARSDAAAALDRIDERIAHSAACHAAVKAGQALNEREQLELVRLLYTLEGTEHCPHGRPTTLDLSWGDLDRRFQR